jgi:hypothetical protein
MGEPEFIDRCTRDFQAGSSPCHMMGGWTKGAITCPLWEQIANLCQTEDEQQFLHEYIQIVKHRIFPMLIPQARIGITQRRRPDFVVFVPLQRWKYRWYAIELDGKHRWKNDEIDRERNEYLNMNHYHVISVKTTNYYKEVKCLVERIEGEISIATSNPWDVAIEMKVKKVETEFEQLIKGKRIAR